MKKIIIVGAIVLVTAFIGMPYVMGVVAEKATLNIVDNMNKDANINGSTEIVSYQRNFGSTQASYTYTPPSSFADIGWTFGEIEYQCDGSHGILDYSYSCNLVSAGDYKAFIDEHLAGKDPLSIKGDVSIFGNLTQIIQVDAFKVNEDGDELDFGLAVVEITTDKSLRDYTIDGEFAGASFLEGDTESKIGKAFIDGDMYITEDKLQFGSITLELSEFDIQSPSESNVTFSDLAFELNSKEQGDTVAFDYLVKINKLLLSKPEESYNLEKLSFGLKAQGLDRKSLVELNELLQDYSKQGGEFTPEQTFKALPLIEAMLRKDLALSFDLNTDFQDQTLKGKFDTRLIDQVSMAELSLLALDPESALDKLTFSTSMMIPDSIIKTQPQLSHVLLSSPFFEQAKNGFKNDLVVEKGNISLNGDKLSLNDLITIVMQSAPF